MSLNLQLSFESSALAAPQSFRDAMQAAANILDGLILNNITVTILVGYGDWDNNLDTGLTTGAEGGSLNDVYESYSALRTALANNETSAADQTFVNSLPNTSSVNGVSRFDVPSATAKALGLISPTNPEIDGAVGMGMQIPTNLLVGVALHELTHAMGREPGVGPFDLFRYTSPGNRLFSSANTAPAAYFSIDGGVTKLADFGRNSDPSDFLNSGVQGPYDAFNEFYSSNTLQSLSAVDKELLDVMGFSITPTTATGIVVAAMASDALQGGPSVTLLSQAPSITDPGETTLLSASITVANGSGAAVTGDEIYINGQQNGTVAGGLVTVGWNDATKILTFTGNVSIATYQTLLSQIVYKDTGIDSSTGHPQRTVTWTVNDGTSNLSTTSKITVDRAPVANNDTTSDNAGAVVSAAAAAGVLHNDSDLDNDALIVSGVANGNGAGIVGQPYAGSYGHLTLNADGSYAYIADVASAIANAASGSHPQDAFIYTANDGNGGTAKAVLSISIERSPVVIASNVTATHNQSFAASSLFSVTDADGDTVTTYDLYDQTGNGHFVVNGVAQAADTVITVTAAQLAQTTYQSGSGADQLYVQASDGTLWSAWQGFTVTAPLDHAPVVTVANLTAMHGQTSIAASSLFSVTDADGDAITAYDFYDATGNGHFVINGVAQTADTVITVTAAQLGQTSYQVGAAADTLYVQAYDGTLWSAWQPFTVSPWADHTPVVTASNVTATHNQSFAASSLFSVTDADGDAITAYDFYDATGSGHFVVNGVVQAADTVITVTAAQLAQTTYQSGSGADQLYVQASDGTLWSAWQGFTVTAPLDHAPAVMVSNITATHNQSFAASSLFSVTDADGDAITAYDFYDATGTGHFVVNGVVQAADTVITVTAAQLAQTTYQSGSGADQLYVQASDGTLRSTWQGFTVTAPLDYAPVVTVSNVTTLPGQTFTSSDISVSDPEGDTITAYNVYDVTGNGHFVVNGVTQPTATVIPVTPAQLAQSSYVSGLGTDQLYAQAYDGTLWSPWQGFTVTGISPATISAGQTLDLPSAYSGTVNFAAATGALRIENSASFTGKVSGLTAQDVLDFGDITAGANATVGYSGTSSSGTLTVSDGSHTAIIALLGNYMAASFVPASDGHGGTYVVDPPQAQSSLLTQPVHA
jgi:VCBS repeat-containing protein